MIQHIHDRLVTWASAALSDTLGALSYSSCSFDVEDVSERSHDSVALWSPAVEEIERAVNDLRYELRETIKAIYLEPEATMQQSAKRIGCDVRTLRRRRDSAQKQIELILDSNKTFFVYVENNACKRVRLLENAS